MTSRIRTKSLAMGVLKGVAIAGLVAVAATSPYFGIGLIKGLQKYKSKERWRKFYHSLNYLDRRGYVRILKDENGQTTVRLSRKGEVAVKKLDFSNLKLPEPGVWDGKWRVVIFDVPTYKHKNRRAFAEKLKELGFIMVQKSVWAYPFECYKEMAVVRKFYEVEKYVTYLEAVEIEDELHWRGKFNLSFQKV